MIRRRYIAYLILFVTIAQVSSCYNKEKESDNSLFNNCARTGLLMNDSQAHDVLIGGEIAVNNAYDAAPKPDWGTRIAGSFTTWDWITIEYDWSIDQDGNWDPPSTLKLKFDSYYVDLSLEDAEADAIELNGNCRLDISGGTTSLAQEKRIRHMEYLFIYYYPEPGSTNYIGMHFLSDYTLTEIFSPDYAVCYSGSFAGRNVIPLVEPGGDGCLQ